MHTSTIYVNPTLPDEIGFAQAAGTPGDVRFYFKSPNGLPYVEIANLNPQLVMRPFTSQRHPTATTSTSSTSPGPPASPRSRHRS